MKGVYQHCSEKHLHRYLAEFDFRYSHRVARGFIKLEAKHGEINFSHYQHMSSILVHGFVAMGREPRLLDYWWVRPDGGFFVVLKATANNEVFVKTFHPIHLKEARRLFRRALEQNRLIRIQRDVGGLLKLRLEVA